MSSSSKSLKDSKIPLSYVWLGIAGVLNLFVNGNWSFILAAWLMPVFMLRFIRTQKPWRGFLSGVTVVIITSAISLWGIIPVYETWLYLLIISAATLPAFGAYMLDRWLTKRWQGFGGTLVFPLAVTTLEYINSVTSPYTTWGSLAYTQFGFSPLTQLVSVTGLWGVTFLVAWFGAMINWLWEQSFEWSKVSRGVFSYAVIMLVVLSFGVIRLITAATSPQSVQIAGVTAGAAIFNNPTMEALFTGKATAEQTAQFKATLEANQNSLVERTQQAAQRGAKIVYWGEGNGMIFKEDEANFTEKLRQVAQQEKIYLGAAMLVFSEKPPFENKVILISPQGQLLSSYLKSQPVPGEAVVKGDGIIPRIATPYGVLGSVICYDLDFPGLIGQLSQREIDLLIAPSNDWREVKFLHMQMVTFRALMKSRKLCNVADWTLLPLCSTSSWF